ncbi:MAG: hypothetical protein ACI8XX_000278 [Polaribacter sp.]|jgi:hypothetical protein
MPYYVFKITIPDGIGLIKNLKFIEQFEKYRDAKKSTKSLRVEAESDDQDVFKIMFADNQLLAEEQLLEKREKPVLMEHEQ